MQKEEQIKFVKKCFETYYASFEDSALMGESKRINNLEVEDGGVPLEMEDGMPNEDGWIKWKLIQSCVTESDVNDLEQDFGVSFPQLFKTFLSSYYHLFDSDHEIGAQPSDNPFEGVEAAYNPILTKFHYLPFAWDRNYGCIRCIDLRNMPNEDSCAIYEIDHEHLFDFNEITVTQKEVDEHMKIVCDNFQSYLIKCFL